MFIYDKIVKYLEPRDVFNASMKMHEDEWCLKVTYQAVYALLTDSELYDMYNVQHTVCQAWHDRCRYKVPNNKILSNSTLVTKFLAHKIPNAQNS